MADKQTGSRTTRNPAGHAELPPLYRVVLLNDDYTPMDFVVRILVSIFGKTQSQATDLMLAVHRSGSAVAGIYPLEIAETKAEEVHEEASASGHPLSCRVEIDE